MPGGEVGVRRFAATRRWKNKKENSGKQIDELDCQSLDWLNGLISDGFSLVVFVFRCLGGETDMPGT
jgi:hypothetical protein